MGVMQGLAQILLTSAYQRASPSHIAPINYMLILFVALFGWLFYNQIPDISATIGILLIVVGGLIATLHAFIQSIFAPEKP